MWFLHLCQASANRSHDLPDPTKDVLTTRVCAPKETLMVSLGVSTCFKVVCTIKEASDAHCLSDLPDPPQAALAVSRTHECATIRDSDGKCVSAQCHACMKYIRIVHTRTCTASIKTDMNNSNSEKLQKSVAGRSPYLPDVHSSNKANPQACY